MSIETSNYYFVQVEIDGEWVEVEGIGMVLEKEFKNKPDVGFPVSTKQKEELSKYERKRLRFFTAIMDSEENIVGYKFKEMRSWCIQRGQVLVLDPNKNYKEYTLSPEEFSF